MSDTRANTDGTTTPTASGGGPRGKSGMTAFAAGTEERVTLADLFKVIRRRWWVVFLVATMLSGATVGASLSQTPKYEASITILVGQESGLTGQDPNSAMGLQQLTLSMAEGISSHRLAKAVIRREGLAMSPEEFLEEHLSVEQVSATQYIEVTYTDSDPQRAQRVANTVGDVFSEQISQVSQSANAITATVWDPAVTPEEPVGPSPLRNGLLALLVGLMLGVGLALLLEYLDDSWRSPEEVEQVSGVPTYGVIPNYMNYAKTKKGRY